MDILLFIKRFVNRLKHLFRLKEILNWKYETCDRCGITYKMCYSAKDKHWNMIYPNGSGCLCIDCFIIKMNELNINICLADFEKVWIFNPVEKGDIKNV